MRPPCLAAFLLCSCLASTALAGTISSVASTSLPGSSTGTVGPVGATPAPNNDNTSTLSPNTIPVSIFFNALGMAELAFAVAVSGGSTEYAFTQTLINNTGQSWTGFKFELGFGTGSGFTPSSSLDALDFDTPNLDLSPTSSVFTALGHQADVLAWSGATVPAVSAVLFTFSVDVPDGLASLNPSGLSEFTLRGTPLVAPPIPEPSTVLLLGAGLAGLVLRRLGGRQKRTAARDSYRSHPS